MAGASVDTEYRLVTLDLGENRRPAAQTLRVETILTKRYEVSSFLVNPQKKLGLYALLNLLQDCAWAHATHLGVGYEVTLQQGLIWVLIRQKVVMASWPGWGEEVEIRTWARPYQGTLAVRDYEILSGDSVVGHATSGWVLLDVQQRFPVRSNLADVPSRADYAVDFDPPRLSPRQDLTAIGTFRVRNSDLDMHEHVNNTRYAQWILDSVDRSWHSLLQLREYEINFLAEAQAGEEITMLQSTPELKGAPTWVHFQAVRERDQKPVFVARLQVCPFGDA